MGWNEGCSLERAKKKYDVTEGLVVGDIVRETDLERTMLKNPRRIRAAHVYVDIPQFRSLLGDGEPNEEMLRRMHLWAREVTKIVEGDFNATKVHFQGPKLHALSYRPVGDDHVTVVKAVLLAAAVRATVPVFNDVLELDTDEAWSAAGGVDFGDALVTKDGVAGDRELLFLGNPANVAAKIIAGNGLRLTAEVADLLPADVADEVFSTGQEDVYSFTPTAKQLEELVALYGYGWSRENSRDRLVEAVSACPAGAATVHDASSKIDKGTLGFSNSKRVHAVSIFADVDGFTAYVAEADAAGTLPEAVRAYHVIRSEMRNTAVDDYEALRIQYQGDRMQALAYLPLDDAEQVALTAVRIAAALNSVTTHVLPEVIGEAARPIAIGLAAGRVLVSKLGQHGDRDVVSLGRSTAEAARIQQALDGGQIGIDRELRDRLPAWLQGVFVWDGAPRAYVAKDLTLDEFERLEASESSSVAKGLLKAAIVGSAAAAVGTALIRSRREGNPDDPPLRPWLD